METEKGVLFERGRLLFDLGESFDLFYPERSKSKEHDVLERAKCSGINNTENNQKSKKNEENQS